MKADEKEGRGEKEKEEMEERYKAEEEEWERSRKWHKIRKKIISKSMENDDYSFSSANECFITYDALHFVKE